MYFLNSNIMTVMDNSMREKKTKPGSKANRNRKSKQYIEMKLELSGVGVLGPGFGIRKEWLEIGFCGTKVANSSFCKMQMGANFHSLKLKTAVIFPVMQ